MIQLKFILFYFPLFSSLPVQSDIVYAVNCGSSSSYISFGGIEYEAVKKNFLFSLQDNYFTEGVSYNITTTEPIKLTRDATLYQTAHCGTLTYTITLPEEGQYMLQFKTVEFQYNQTNSRQTKITLNDKILASNSNPYH